MNKKGNIELSTSEIAQLWTTYMNDTLSSCMLQYFLQHVDDKQIEGVIEFGLSISQKHIKFLESLFEENGFKKPIGFTKDDVNLNAKKLYSDSFYLYYLKNMATIGGNGYSLALGNSARLDIQQFFMECTQQTADLYHKAVSILLEKGLFIRPPQINLPDKVDFVYKQSFLTGWFGEKRPLTSIEIMNLFFNIERNDLGRSLLTGFYQTAQSKIVKEYLKRGAKIAAKHIEVFGSVLSESNLPTPMVWNSLPTDSTEQVFSDKLMMFHISALTAASTSHYGTSLGSSPRRDIGAHYVRLIAEIMKYGEDGANIMIDNGWLEQPPSATDREKLV